MRVVVEDGLIRRIGTAGGPAGPRDVRVIDCQGRTLMPGLLDAHVHLALLDLDPAAEAVLPPAVLALRIKNEIEATLDAGFTTVRDAGGLDWGFKEAVRLGLVRGPRIFISGAFISQTGGHGDHRARTSRGTFPEVPGLTSESILADGADQVRRAAREVLRRGADQVKVMASGGGAPPPHQPAPGQVLGDGPPPPGHAAGAPRTPLLAPPYWPRAGPHTIKDGARPLQNGNL